LKAATALLALTAAFTVDIRATRTVSGVRVRLAVTDALTHTPIRRWTAPDTPIDMFIVGGAGLRVFRHHQPGQQRDGSFVADFALPDAGWYMAFAEFVPKGAWPQTGQQAFAIDSPLGPRPGDLADEPHVSNGIRGALDGSALKSGVESALVFDIFDDASGAPVADLDEYLHARAHVFAVSADLTEAQHCVPQDDRAGPRLAFLAMFPRPGRYKLWLEVRRAGRAATVPFVIDVQ